MNMCFKEPLVYQADLQYSLWAANLTHGPSPRFLSCYLRSSRQDIFANFIGLQSWRRIYRDLLPSCCPLQCLAGCAGLPATRIPTHPVCLSHPGKTRCGPSLPHQHDLHLHLPITHRVVCRHRAGKMRAKGWYWGGTSATLFDSPVGII